MNKKDILVIRSKRKTVSIEIKSDLTVIIRAPIFMSDRKIDKFIKSKADWLEKHLEIVKKRAENRVEQPCFSQEEIMRFTEKAKIVLPEKVKNFALKFKIDYGKVSVRHQKTRWGSCSSKGNLNFNCLLMLCPDEIVDYVVVHELAHIKYMNHSKEYWQEVEKMMPDYKWREKWLKQNGNDIISRLK